jgi:DNA replication and repair protein RecF
VGLKELTVRDFRLFREFSFRPDPSSITVFVSPNGTGKTSVLEAVYALATASSFRTTSASDMINNQATVAEVHGLIEHQERRLDVHLTLTRNARNTTKRMTINGQRPSSRAELSASLPITVFTPEGVEIVRSGPDGRRSFLNTLLGDVTPRHNETLETFHRVLQQRNALLHGLEGHAPSRVVMEDLEQWTSEFISAGSRLLSARHELLDGLAPLVQEKYQELSESDAKIELRYEPSWGDNPEMGVAAAMRTDFHRGYSTVGPHRDDIALLLDSRDARRQASQGEQRSLALALRLAGHELVRQSRAVDPLLLLDDVFSELDPFRSNALLRLLPVGQTLVSTATPLPEAMRAAAVIDLTTLNS